MMQDIIYTVMEYEESHDALRKRINELNAQITATDKCDSALKRLMERRSTLYTQIWDIEFALRELREYIGRREVNLKVG